MLIQEAPLREAIEPEKKTVYASFKNKNPFKGKPSDELDHAWHQLFINSNVRVTEEDLAKINKTSVPITDEIGGYYAIPGKTFLISCLMDRRTDSAGYRCLPSIALSSTFALVTG